MKVLECLCVRPSCDILKGEGDGRWPQMATERAYLNAAMTEMGIWRGNAQEDEKMDDNGRPTSGSSLQDGNGAR